MSTEMICHLCTKPLPPKPWEGKVTLLKYVYDPRLDYVHTACWEDRQKEIESNRQDYAGAGDIKCCHTCGSRNCFCHALP